MTEEDLQAEVQASKTSKELQELADLEEAQRLQAKMDAETQRQIDLDALLARRLVEQEEEAAQEALATEFDYIQARLNADQILAEKLQQEDERAIKTMNEKATHKEEEKKDESVHEEVKEEEGAKKRKLGTRRKLKAKRRKHASSLTREDDDLKICLHIAPDEDKILPHLDGSPINFGHGLDECVSMSTPMATERPDADLQGTPTDQTTYRRMIGGLMYLTASRPDIAYATFVCARYQARPTIKHLKEVKRIFWYLRQSYNMGLWYLKNFGFELIAYSDANHAGCKDDCKSTSGGLQSLGEKLVSWSSQKQDCTAMSTAEAEYVSLSAFCAQVIWMRTQLLDYRYKYNRILIYCDSKSAIAISCNPV
ncbi:hypothetical protein Tco_1574377 [Tanacetum coccineum]